jgi:uroporphyrinogen decarboxylase-like protein
MQRRSMTSRQRWLAALDMKPVDRLPFWPKLDGAYAGMQASPYNEMTNDQLHEWIGSDPHVGITSCVRVDHTETSIESTTVDDERTTLYIAGGRTLTKVDRFDDLSCSWHPVVFPVKSLDDVQTLREVYEDMTIHFDRDGWLSALEEVKLVGERAATVDGVGTTPIMEFLQHFAGIDSGQYLLIDHPDEVGLLFKVMQRVLRKKARVVVSHSPADMIYLVENTSTTLVSPDQFRKYNLKHMRQIAKICQKGARRLILHMCGLLSDILPDIASLNVTAYEAFTCAPVGNTSLFDGRTASPTVCLIGGTSADLWLQPASVIIEHIRESLQVLPHHRGIVVTSAGVMPPLCKPETIREVCEWVKAYEVRG